MNFFFGFILGLIWFQAYRAILRWARNRRYRDIALLTQIFAFRFRTAYAMFRAQRAWRTGWKTFQWHFWEQELPKERQALGWTKRPLFRLQRDNPRVPTVILSKARVCSPPIYDTIFTLFPCKHRNLKTEFENQGRTAAEVCQRCGKSFNYRLVEETDDRPCSPLAHC